MAVRKKIKRTPKKKAAVPAARRKAKAATRGRGKDRDRQLQRVLDNIAALQDAQDVTDAELERRAGMRPGSLWIWRRRRRGGQVATLMAIAEALGVEPAHLLQGC